MKKNGFSLIEVMVAIGLMSIMSVGMMDMISNQNKSIKTTQMFMDLNEAQNKIQRYMLDSDICTDSLAGTSIPINGVVAITSLKKTGSPTLLSTSAGSNTIGGVEVQSMSITRQNATDLLLSIQFKKSANAQKTYGGDNFIRKINLSAQFIPATNTVKNCFSQLDSAVASAVEMACAQLCPTCTWDPVNINCIKPAGGINKPLYLNNTTGQLTTTAAPSSFPVKNCFSEGSSHSYAHTCGVAKTNVTNQCAAQGATLSGYTEGHGGCGGGNKQSCTGKGTCVYNFTLQGYLTSIPN
jgi:prepilin-type N-terminal cleavage/methylation domain-containing protein